MKSTHRNIVYHAQQFASIRMFKTLHSCVTVYLQHGGGNYFRQNHVTVIPCRPVENTKTNKLHQITVWSKKGKPVPKYQ